MTERFLQAAMGGNIAALMRILAPDVTLWTDGGGKVRRVAALRPIHGAGKVTRVIARTAGSGPEDLDVRCRTVNGDPSAVLFDADAPFAVMVLDLDRDGDRIRGVYAVTNPDKLTRITEEG